MGRNVFVSYKYADEDVQHLYGCWPTTARNYVTEIESLLSDNGHAYFGEREGQDLSYLSDDQIWEKLKDRIFPTSCTIVLISPNMKEDGKYDKSQWIPWEIAFSIRETRREGYTSRRNGILAVVLPDSNGSYEYMLKEESCCVGGCVKNYRAKLFTILKENMFNIKYPDKHYCNNGDTIWYGEHSYIPMVTWAYFKNHVDSCIERVESIRKKAGDYKLHLSVNQ